MPAGDNEAVEDGGGDPAGGDEDDDVVQPASTPQAIRPAHVTAPRDRTGQIIATSPMLTQQRGKPVNAIGELREHRAGNR